jgi:uncharacterized protein (DUF1697 family)
VNTYIILLRGINVGGKNKLPMLDLKKCLEELGFSDILTYIASGNVILKSHKNAPEIQSLIEDVLLKRFKLNSELIKALVLTKEQLQKVIINKPKGFGEHPDKYHSDIIFLMDVGAADAIKVFKPREGVDEIWQGDEVIYSQRLSSMRTKSRLNRVMSTPLYKSMTIRTWNTTIKLLALVV